MQGGQAGEEGSTGWEQGGLDGDKEVVYNDVLRFSDISSIQMLRI